MHSYYLQGSRSERLSCSDPSLKGMNATAVWVAEQFASKYYEVRGRYCHAVVWRTALHSSALPMQKIVKHASLKLVCMTGVAPSSQLPEQVLQGKLLLVCVLGSQPANPCARRPAGGSDTRHCIEHLHNCPDLFGLGTAWASKSVSRTLMGKDDGEDRERQMGGRGGGWSVPHKR